MSTTSRLLTACLLMAGPSCGERKALVPKFPEDEVLKSRFVAHEADFKKLAGMSTADPNIWRITKDFSRVFDGVGTTPRAASEQELPVARWNEYRRLFEKLQLPIGLIRESECVLFAAATVDIGAVDSEEKGYAFCPRRPDPVFESLDSTPLAVEKPMPAFRVIRDGWYLYWRYNE